MSQRYSATWVANCLFHAVMSYQHSDEYSNGYTQQHANSYTHNHADNNDRVNALDFTILKSTFGKTVGSPGYDTRADFNGDTVITAVDATLQRGNFGHAGGTPTPVVPTGP